MVNTHELIHEVVVSRSADFSDRPLLQRVLILLNFGGSLGFSRPTPKWKYSKKLAMQSLKTYGDGPVHLDELSLQAINEMMAELTEYAKSDAPVDMMESMHKCVTGMMSMMVSDIEIYPYTM